MIKKKYPIAHRSQAICRYRFTYFLSQFPTFLRCNANNNARKLNYKQIYHLFGEYKTAFFIILVLWNEWHRKKRENDSKVNLHCMWWRSRRSLIITLPSKSFALYNCILIWNASVLKWTKQQKKKNEWARESEIAVTVKNRKTTAVYVENLLNVSLFFSTSFFSFDWTDLWCLFSREFFICCATLWRWLITREE